MIRGTRQKCGLDIDRKKIAQLRPNVITLLMLFVPAVIGGALGYYIGRTKGHEWLGAVLGFFFCAIGWVVVLLLPPASINSEESTWDSNST